MAVELSLEQRQAIRESGESPLYVFNPEDRTWYVLVPADQYERSDELAIRETYALQERVAQAEGWAEPSMDDYNDYDAHRVTRLTARAIVVG